MSGATSVRFTPASMNYIGGFALSFGFTFDKNSGILFNANVFDRIVLSLGSFGQHNSHLFEELAVMTRVCAIYEDHTAEGGDATNLARGFSGVELISSTSGSKLLLKTKFDFIDANMFILNCTAAVTFPSSTLILPIKIQVYDYRHVTLIDETSAYTFPSTFPPATAALAFGYPLLTWVSANSQAALASLHFAIKTTSIGKRSREVCLAYNAFFTALLTWKSTIYV